jgi:hypothetical protein
MLVRRVLDCPQPAVQRADSAREALVRELGIADQQCVDRRFGDLVVGARVELRGGSRERGVGVGDPARAQGIDGRACVIGTTRAERES